MIPPSGNENPKNSSERQRAILAWLKQAGTLTVQDLADAYTCSLATIRRDIQELVKQEPFIHRYHGAIGLEPQSGEQWFNEKTSLFIEEKDALARLVVQWLPPDAVIGLNGGTTTTRVAVHIAKHRPDLTVVTNAINIAYQLAQAEVAVVVIGGDLRPYNFETTGDMAIQGLSGLHLDWTIMGANGIHPRVGITTTASEEALLGKTFCQVADRVLIIADHSKIDHNALYRMLDWNDVDYVATGMQADPVMKDWPVDHAPILDNSRMVGIWPTEKGRDSS